MLMRTTPCWNSQNLWVTKTTWQNWKRFWWKLTWLSHAQKIGPLRSGGFFKLTNLTKFAALLRDIPMGLQGCGSAWISLKKSYSQLPYFWKEYKKTLQWQSLSLQSTCSPLAWNWETRGRNIKVIQSLLLTVQILSLQNFKEFAWMIFHLWKV